MSNHPTLQADKLYHGITPAELRFARRSARYLANQHLTPCEIRDALMEQLDLPARPAETIVVQLMTEASPNPVLAPAA